MLTAQKESMRHGEWLPWIKANEKELGFGERTVQRLINLAANPTLATDLWGHDYDEDECLEDSQLIQQSLSNEHYTPKIYIEAARLVLGQIDLDPASCIEANKIIKASKFYTEKDNGLKRKWSGTVWLNPPYGRLAGDFIAKLVSEINVKNVPAAITLVNAHCTDTSWFQHLWPGLLCFTNHRINFYGDDERSGSTHGSVFVYFGNNQKGFFEHFAQFGAVVARVS